MEEAGAGATPPRDALPTPLFLTSPPLLAAAVRRALAKSRSAARLARADAAAAAAARTSAAAASAAAADRACASAGEIVTIRGFEVGEEVMRCCVIGVARWSDGGLARCDVAGAGEVTRCGDERTGEAAAGAGDGVTVRIVFIDDVETSPVTLPANVETCGVMVVICDTRAVAFIEFCDHAVWLTTNCADVEDTTRMSMSCRAGAVVDAAVRNGK